MVLLTELNFKEERKRKKIECDFLSKSPAKNQMALQGLAAWRHVTAVG